MPKPKPIARPLGERIANARQQGRTQQALELTRQLFKQEPTEEHRQLLRQVTLERGQQLQDTGNWRDAATLYVNALTLRGSPEFDTALVAGLAATGRSTEALQLIGELSGADGLRARVVAQAADCSIPDGPAALEGLGPEVLAQREIIVSAFAASAAGRDDEARTLLQGIGLQSPFLEWKVLLRGLLAYYANDDARALENWQRLDPKRLPARLVAPLRFSIDPAYQAAQAPATQKLLAERSARLCGSALQQSLLGLQEKLTQENLGPAFRQAEAALPALRRDFPALVPRLADCFYWAIIDQGEPEDMGRYARVFGAPVDDPAFDRLEALAMEERGMYADAHKKWQQFLKVVADTPAVWPVELGRSVQALVWAHMGENAWSDLPKKKKHRRHPLFDSMFEEEPPLRPSAEECFRRSVALAPERLGPYLALFNLYRQEGELAKAKKIGNDYLKRDPNHVSMLHAMGDVHQESGEQKKALEFFERALRVNPLDPALRIKLSRAHQNWALELTVADKFAEARAQYQAALALCDVGKSLVQCQWAVLEMKAGASASAEELLAQARAEPDQRLATGYAVVCESVRAKVPPKERKVLAAAFESDLAATPTPREILALLATAARLRLERHDAFHGQKKREKDLQKFIDRLPLRDFDEAQLERLAASLTVLEDRMRLHKCIRMAIARYPKNPIFHLAWVDYHLIGRYPEEEGAAMRGSIERARKLVEEMPRGERQQQILERIEQLERRVEDVCGPPFNPLTMLDPFGGFFDDEEDDF